MRAAAVVTLCLLCPTLVNAQAPSPSVAVRQCEAAEAEALGAAMRLELSELSFGEGDTEISVDVICAPRHLVVSTDAGTLCSFQDVIPRGEATTRAAALAAAEQVSACQELRAAPPRTPPPPREPREAPAGGVGVSVLADVLGPVYTEQPWLAGATVGLSLRAGHGQLSVAASYWGGRRRADSGDVALHVVSARVAGGAALRLGARANLELLVGARVGDAVLAGRRAQGAATAERHHVWWASPTAVVGLEIMLGRLSLPIELEAGMSPRRAIGRDVDGRVALRWGGAWARFAVGVRL